MHGGGYERVGLPRVGPTDNLSSEADVPRGARSDLVGLGSIYVVEVGCKEQSANQARDESQRSEADEEYTLRHRFSKPKQYSKRES